MAETANNLQSKAYATILDLVSEGEIEGLADGLKSIYLNDTPLQNTDGTMNFSGVTVDSRNGTQSQTYIPGFAATESEISVGLEVKKATPITKTVTNENVNAVRVTMSFPALFKQNTSNGDVNGYSVRYKIQVQSNGGGYVDKVDNTVSGKTTGKYEKAHRIELTGSAPWDIRVVRVSDDDAVTTKQSKTFWASYAEIIDAKLRYPNSAIIGVRVDSSQFNGIPTRAYELKLLKVQVPTNYNPTTRVYTGSWDGTFKTAWTDNPAWCYYDLITKNRYGLGKYLDVTQVDKWSLYQIAKYCDQLVPNGFGGYEPRFTCNLYIQSRNDAFKVVQDFVSVFRAMAYWASGSLTMVQDAPSDPVALFTNANVIEGTFTYAGSSSKARHTVAIVRWNDPNDMYRQSVEYVEDREGIDRYGYIETDVVAFGCTSRGQAHRVGRWILFTERLETESVTFRVGLDGALARPGNVIQVADKERAGARQGGRIVSATNTTVVLDAAPSGAVGGKLYLVSPSGVVMTSTVTSVAQNELTISPALPSIPQVNSTWILSTAAIEPQTFRVVTIVEADQGSYEVTAIAHDPQKYDAVENNLVIEQRNISNLSSAPDTPADLSVSEYLYKYQAEVRVGISVAWKNVDRANSYRVQWQKDGGNFETAVTTSNYYELLNMMPGTYTFKVWAISALNKESKAPVTLTQAILGKSVPPANVTGFGYAVDANIGVTLYWTANSDLDVDYYEIRQGSNYSSSTLLGTVKATNFTVPTLPYGSTTFFIKAVDTSGNYSLTASSTTVDISQALQPTVTGVYVGPDLVLSWSAVAGTFATSSYEIRYGSTWADGTLVGTAKTTTFSAKGNWSGTRSFWVAAKDLNGNYGAPGKFDAVIQAPKAVTINQQVIDNNILLQWTDATNSLPIDHYEIRKGSTYAASTLIGTVSGRFTTVFESSAGDFKYWVTGFDTAGNVGASASMSATINQPPDYVLNYNYDTQFTAGTATNMAPQGGDLFGPVDTTQTWQSHFTSNGWTSPQDQINAGFPYYLEKSASTGSYEESIDYGTVLPATSITVTPTYQVITGSANISLTISVRKLTTDPWTTYTGVSNVYATDFRYMKFKLDVTSAGGDDVVQISNVNVRFDVKLKNDAGTAAANASDSGGTTVYFNTDFVDVQSINVSPQGTAARFAIYDFTDVANPTSFKILLFDTAGNRVSGNVGWTAKGV